MMTLAFLLKSGDGSIPPLFSTVGGFRTTRMAINAEPVVATSQGYGEWLELLSGTGSRSVSVSGSGVFVSVKSEAQVKGAALSGNVADYQIVFDSGETVTGRFLITRLDYVGELNGERTWAVALESAGLLEVRS